MLKGEMVNRLMCKGYLFMAGNGPAYCVKCLPSPRRRESIEFYKKFQKIYKLSTPVLKKTKRAEKYLSQQRKSQSEKVKNRKV